MHHRLNLDGTTLSVAAQVRALLLDGTIGPETMVEPFRASCGPVFDPPALPAWRWARPTEQVAAKIPALAPFVADQPWRLPNLSKIKDLGFWPR